MMCLNLGNYFRERNLSLDLDPIQVHFIGHGSDIKRKVKIWTKGRTQILSRIWTEKRLPLKGMSPHFNQGTSRSTKKKKNGLSPSPWNSYLLRTQMIKCHYCKLYT